MSGVHGDPPGTGGDLAGAPSDNEDYDVPVHNPYTGLHLHRHSSLGGPGGQVDGSHIHAHDHQGDGSHTHEHAGDAAVDYYDANGMPVYPDPADPEDGQGPVSSSGRRPSGSVHRRSQDWGLSDLSSRLTQCADEVANIQRDMFRCHVALQDNEALLDTADVMAQRDELQRVWHRLTEQEAQAHSRLRTVQAAWAQVEHDFTFGREGDGIRGGARMEP